ncbi:hypothetical protein HanLR1_Chr16g0645261 [Helianthus annuus]|nr:hypothetical protein HanLR1_Chr16g0645261 [Helianthus annuus]
MCVCCVFPAAVLRNLADRVAYDSRHPPFQYVAASEDLQADEMIQ